MNARFIKRLPASVVQIASVAIRHGVASIATVVGTCVAWTVTYGALLIWAMATGGGLGGPLAYPGGLVLIALTTATACVVLFFPATVSAEWVCRKRRLPVLAEIPATVAILAVLCAVVGIIVRSSTAMMPFGLTLSAFIVWLFALSLLPVGFYWWVAEAVPLVQSALKLVAGRRPRFVHGG